MDILTGVTARLPLCYAVCLRCFPRSISFMTGGDDEAGERPEGEGISVSLFSLTGFGSYSPSFLPVYPEPLSFTPAHLLHLSAPLYSRPSGPVHCVSLFRVLAGAEAPVYSILIMCFHQQHGTDYLCIRSYTIWLGN